MSDGKEWLETHGIHTKVDITGLALEASYKGWALEYKSMFGMERKLHVNPFFFSSYLGAEVSSPGWGNFFKTLGSLNDIKLHVTDSASLGIGSSADVHYSAVHYSSNRGKDWTECLAILLVLSVVCDLVLVILSANLEKNSTKNWFYILRGTSEFLFLVITVIAVTAKETTHTLTNLQANLAATTSRLKKLAGYNTDILDQLHPLIGSHRLQAAKTIMKKCVKDAEKAIKTAKNVANQLAGAPAH